MKAEVKEAKSIQSEDCHANLISENLAWISKKPACRKNAMAYQIHIKDEKFPCFLVFNIKERTAQNVMFFFLDY